MPELGEIESLVSEESKARLSIVKFYNRELTDLCKWRSYDFKRLVLFRSKIESLSANRRQDYSSFRDRDYYSNSVLPAATFDPPTASGGRRRNSVSFAEGDDGTSSGVIIYEETDSDSEERRECIRRISETRSVKVSFMAAVRREYGNFSCSDEASWDSTEVEGGVYYGICEVCEDALTSFNEMVREQDAEFNKICSLKRSALTCNKSNSSRLTTFKNDDDEDGCVILKSIISDMFTPNYYRPPTAVISVDSLLE